MRALYLPLRDAELRRQLFDAARREERSPAQQALFLLRRALRAEVEAAQVSEEEVGR